MAKGLDLERRERQSVEQQIIRALKREGFEVTRPAGQEQFPPTIQLDGLEELSPRGKGALTNAVISTRQYLAGYIIRDSYGDTDVGRRARQDAWGRIEKRYGSHVAGVRTEDKLRLGSTINELNARFEILAMMVGNIQTPQAGRIRELQTTLDGIIAPLREAGAYGAMSTEEKVGLSEKVDEVAESFLRLMTRGVDAA